MDNAGTLDSLFREAVAAIDAGDVASVERHLAEHPRLVRDRLEEQVAFDPSDVRIGVRGGVVHLSGRVGTDEELRIVEHVVTDLIGIKEVKNDLVVDPIRRAESPVPIDEHLVDEEMHEGIGCPEVFHGALAPRGAGGGSN